MYTRARTIECTHARMLARTQTFALTNWCSLTESSYTSCFVDDVTHTACVHVVLLELGLYTSPGRVDVSAFCCCSLKKCYSNYLHFAILIDIQQTVQLCVQNFNQLNTGVAAVCVDPYPGSGKCHFAML